MGGFNGDYTDISKEAIELFGLKRGELRGLSIEVVFHDMDNKY